MLVCPSDLVLLQHTHDRGLVSLFPVSCKVINQEHVHGSKQQQPPLGALEMSHFSNY